MSCSESVEYTFLTKFCLAAWRNGSDSWADRREHRGCGWDGLV